MHTEDPSDVCESPRQGGEYGPSPAMAPAPGRRRLPTPLRETAGQAPPRALPPSEHYASHLQETSGSAYLYCSMAPVFREVGPEAFKAYLLKVLEEAGNPTDPIERMLVEQIVLAHHNIVRLHVKAASADDLESARVYLGSAALLTGEFRRSISTLKSYREPTKAPAGKAEVAGPDPAAEREGVGGELASNTGGDDDGRTIPLPEPSEGGSGREKPGHATRAKRRRA